MSEECAICGLDIDDKFSYKLPCNHVFHYECIMKTFQNSPKKYKKQFNHCPYCRLKTDYLPLVNGLKKIIPGVHCDFSSNSITDQKNALKTEIASPVLTETLSNSVNKKPPTIQINTDGQTDQCVCFEKKK